jgi:hypothetical protein
VKKSGKSMSAGSSGPLKVGLKKNDGKKPGGKEPVDKGPRGKRK